MHSHCKSFHHLFLSTLVCLPLVCFGAPKETKDPVHVTADELVLNQLEKRVVAITNVIIKQGTLTLWADRVEAYFSKKEGSQKIHLIKAFGNVKIQDQDNTATGDRGIYDLQRGEVILEDNVIISDAKNRVTGSYGIMHQKTGVTRVLNYKPGSAASSKPGRVSALLVSDGQAS